MLALKLIWNITVPFFLCLRRDKGIYHDEGGRIGISMAPMVELLLWVTAITLAFFSSGDGWANSPAVIFFGGIVSITASYIVVALVGKIIRRIRRAG